VLPRADQSRPAVHLRRWPDRGDPARQARITRQAGQPPPAAYASPLITGWAGSFLRCASSSSGPRRIPIRPHRCRGRRSCSAASQA